MNTNICMILVYKVPDFLQHLVDLQRDIAEIDGAIVQVV